MGMLEELNTLLDRIPVWKKLIELPSKVEALQERVAELEARLSKATGDACPKCREMHFTLESSKPLPGHLGNLGAMHDFYRCSSCGHTDRKTRSG